MHIAIIGNGISGITAARWIRKKSDHKITVISSETDHFFSRTALMYIYMGHMRYADTKPYEDWFWEKNRIDLVNDHVVSIEPLAKSLKLKANPPIKYDKLILALGSASNKFGWPGQDLKGVRGLYSYQDVEYMEQYSKGLKRAVIIGGGLIGIEMAEMFHSRHIPVTMLVREPSFWNMVQPPEESQMINRHIIEHGIDLQLSTELKEIVDDGSGLCCAVTTSKGETIDCGFVGLTAGVHPNIGFVKDLPGLNTQKGIVVNDYLETSLDDVYAIGDCAQLENPKPGRRPIEAVWYTGRMMGETVANNICGNKIKYDPGIWFNSAKFLDIEYQVYGTVLANPPENHKSLYWQHPEGKKSIRIVYNVDDEKVVGFNLMGIRYRHEVCEKWLKDRTAVSKVVEQLSLANFDPEFYETYEAEIIDSFNRQTGKQIQKKATHSLDNVFSFLNQQS